MRFLAFVLSLLLLNGQFSRTARAEVTGEEMYQKVCAACHSMNPPPTLAPPVRGIVMNYSQKLASREQFIAAVTDWAKSPAKDKSHMPFAVDRFGLMPPFPLPDKDLTAIAGWMWDSVKGPNAPLLSNKDRAALLGSGIAQELLKAVRARLETELKNGTPESAFKSCSESAMSVTAEVEKQQHQGVTIARISERNRNPANKAQAEDLAILAQFEHSKSKDPVVIEGEDGNFRFYRPIYLEPLCLTCHGPKSSLTPAIQQLIDKSYPGDLASGYKEGDFRGAVRLVIPPPACQH